MYKFATVYEAAMTKSALFDGIQNWWRQYKYTTGPMYQDLDKAIRLGRMARWATTGAGAGIGMTLGGVLAGDADKARKLLAIALGGGVGAGLGWYGGTSIGNWVANKNFKSRMREQGLNV